MHLMQHLMLQQIASPDDAIDANKRSFRHNDYLLKKHCYLPNSFQCNRRSFRHNGLELNE